MKNKKKQSPVPPVPAEVDGIALHCSFDQLVDLSELIPNPRNPNKHPERQIAILAKVIQHQGWRSPIVVSRKTGFIVTGHGRYEAARFLGVERVPVNFQDFPKEADEWAHLIADNRIAELAELDEPELRRLLVDLKDAKADVALTGLTAEAIEELNKVVVPKAFAAPDANLATEYTCPKCSYKWSGKARP